MMDMGKKFFVLSIFATVGAMTNREEGCRTHHRIVTKMIHLELPGRAHTQFGSNDILSFIPSTPEVQAADKADIACFLRSAKRACATLMPQARGTFRLSKALTDLVHRA